MLNGKSGHPVNPPMGTTNHTLTDTETAHAMLMLAHASHAPGQPEVRTSTNNEEKNALMSEE